MLGEKIDDEVNQFKKDLRASGGVVNTIVVVTAARGIAGAENRALLEKKNGGHMDVYRKIRSLSLMRRYKRRYRKIQKSFANCLIKKNKRRFSR